MSRLSAAALTLLIGLTAPALAQMTEVPGPGGIPIAPGLPVPGYTPGGIGPGGVEIAPGPAARGIPMYRIGPGEIPLAPRVDPRPRGTRSAVRVTPGCRGSACGAEFLPESLVLTINSRDAAPAQAPPPDTPIDSIHGLFDALRSCWEPPAPEQAKEGQQMSVRFSYRRTGELVAAPFVTYTTPNTKADTKRTYQSAIDTSLQRCAPMHFTKSFGAAIAGRPISVRYVDDRPMQAVTQGK
jgi:hypothetical protein